MNLRLVLSICRICSENDWALMKLIRGFLAYFMWIRWMEELGGDVGGTDGHLVTWRRTLRPRGRAGGRQGRLEVLEESSSSNLLWFCTDFLH